MAMLNTSTQTEINDERMSGKYLKDIRLKLGLTQTDMAAFLGYAHQKEISILENKDRIPTQLIATLKIIEVNLEAVKHQLRTGIL